MQAVGSRQLLRPVAPFSTLPSSPSSPPAIAPLPQFECNVGQAGRPVARPPAKVSLQVIMVPRMLSPMEAKFAALFGSGVSGLASGSKFSSDLSASGSDTVSAKVPPPHAPLIAAD